MTPAPHAAYCVSTVTSPMGAAWEGPGLKGFRAALQESTGSISVLQDTVGFRGAQQESLGPAAAL